MLCDEREVCNTMRYESKTGNNAMPSSGNVVKIPLLVPVQNFNQETKVPKPQLVDFGLPSASSNNSTLLTRDS